MGYTVAAPCRDEVSKQKMLAFLERNFRHWPEVSGGRDGHQRFYRGPLPDGLPPSERLSYDRGPCRIGFDFNAGGFDREYIFTVCRWMALKVGRVPPVIVYDGDDGQDDGDGDGPRDPAWPVILVELHNELPEDQQWCVVDRWGCLDFTGKNYSARRERRDRMLVQDYGFDGWQVIREEMQRLDSLWTKE